MKLMLLPEKEVTPESYANVNRLFEYGITDINMAKKIAKMVSKETERERPSDDDTSEDDSFKLSETKLKLGHHHGN